MLVLSRKEKESVIIADNVEVTIVEIKGKRVILGFKAPPKIKIHRKEVYDLI